MCVYIYIWGYVGLYGDCIGDFYAGFSLSV